MEAPLSEPFFTKKMEMLNRPDAFMIYGKLGVEYFSNSELLYPNLKIRLQLIRAKSNFYMISVNTNVILGNVDWSFYSRCIALKDDYYKKRLDMLAYTLVEFNSLGTLAKTFIIPAKKTVHSGKHFQQWYSSSDCYCNEYKLNSAFIGSHIENPFGYQQFDFGQIKIFRGGQPIDAGDNRFWFCW